MAHLTHSERDLIESGLRNHDSFKEIARKVGKSPSSISREVLKHRVESNKGAFGRVTNRCVHRRKCDRMGICNLKCSRRCSACAKCNSVCPHYEEDICAKLSQPPYVCNGCKDEHQCVLRKKYYYHDNAETAYRHQLREARTGATLTEEERRVLGKQLESGLERGQSIHHMMVSRKDEFQVCERSVYRYINQGLFSQHPGRAELPKAPGMRPRRKKGRELKIDSKCRIGRSLEDFEQYCHQHHNPSVVEMDSVIGNRGGKVLLTLNFNNCTFLLVFIRDSNNSQSVIDLFNHLEQLLGTDVFKRLFPVILTDNGSEFSNPEALEKSCLSKGRRTRIFYCDPYSSWQKGHVENNHENLRKIFPKGVSLNRFSPEQIQLAVSHLNSFARASLNNIPAISLFEQLYGKRILQKLGIKLIPHDEICLTPQLFD